MKQVIQSYKTGELKVEEVPDTALRRGGILVRNHFSLVSAGTERAVLEFSRKSMIGKARSRPDLVRQVLDKVKTDGLISTYQAAVQKIGEPLALGYSCAGEVMGVGEGAEEFSKGGLVACSGGGYACHSEVVFVPKNLAVRLPGRVSTKEAAFVALGAIALQGIRRAGLSVGERVAVIGLGLIGQLTVQILSAYGFQVLGLDVSRTQIEKALKLGLPWGAVIGQDDIAQTCTQFWNDGGVDAVIITAATKSNEPIELAGSLCRDRGRVSVVGDVGLAVPRNLYYGKELDVRVSRSYGAGRYDSSYEEKGIDYPIGYVRWTENRNMEEFLRLVNDGRVDVQSLITHIFKIEDALKAYELISENPSGEDFTAVLLEYDPAKAYQDKICATETPTPKHTPTSGLTAGLIGGGGFAKNIILPNLKKTGRVRLRAVATATGKSAQMIARKYGCDYATTDYADVLNDKAIDLIIIATRHNLHARIAIEALRRNKDVYLEKPLALNLEELRAVVAAERDSKVRLMVGFNRRFAPHTFKVKNVFLQRRSPLMIFYRINAGLLPSEHWIHDPDEGGGCIIGEVCHFADFLQFVVGAVPVKVYASKISGGGNIISDDNVSIIIDFSDGSRGIILYTTLGSKAFPKEYVEIFGEGKVIRIDNFRRGGPLNLRQDKGHRAELNSFVDSLIEGKPSPVPFREAAISTLVTFKIRESLKEGIPVRIDPREIGIGDE